MRPCPGPLVGYLDPFLYQVFDEVRSGLRAVFGTKNPFTLLIPGTGSSGMETAVTNFVEPARRSLNAWRFLPRPECDKPRCAVNNEI
jgi:aspartate aminotransferase-like enzyme